MRSRCILQLSLIFAAAVLRTQSHSVFHPAMFRSTHPSRSVRSHNPEVLDQKLLESLRSNTPSVLDVALHALSLPNYVILRMVRSVPAYWPNHSVRAKVTKEMKIQNSTSGKTSSFTSQEAASNYGATLSK